MQHETFSIGAVFRLTFQVLGRQWPVVLGAAVIFGGIYTVLEYLYYDTVFMATGEFGANIVSTYVDTVLSFLCQTFVAIRICDDLTGRIDGARQGIVPVLRRLGPVLWIAALASLGIMFGYMLLLIPGVILSLMWFVIMPALVVEDTPISDVFGRSQYLTDGYKWPLLGISLILIVLGVTLTIPIFLLLDETVTGTGIGYWMFWTPIYTVLYGMNAVIASVTFVLLRRTKEGDTPNELAAVFD